MIVLVALQALWAISIPISKILLTVAPPILVTGIRMTLAGILLLAYQYLFTQSRNALSKQHWLLYAQIIFFGIYLKYILRNWGLIALTTTKMAFMLNITPFFVALFSYWFFKERLSGQQWVGLILGFAGLIPILCLSCPGEIWYKNMFFFSWAELAIFAEIAAHSYALILTRKMVKDAGHDVSLTNGIRMLGGGILALLTALCVENCAPALQEPTFYAWVAVLIVISNVICHNFYIYLLKQYSATFLSFTDFLSPLFVAFYGWLFLHETISWHYYIAGITIFIGLYLFYKDELSAFAPKATPDSISYVPQFTPAFITNWIRQPFKAAIKTKQKEI